ncbi:MAG: beta-galactosidase [Trueperaceae bacterium]|nr:beta-galactosidase [Trueperaceae bacterium]
MPPDRPAPPPRAPALGVCYYPEHWPEATWADDAAHMAATGLRWVRIGEFAWSRIERAPGRYDWEWLDRSVDTLAAAGLTLVLCTPSATPPKWLVDAMPDMLPVGRDGLVRGFGGRRHYDPSHEGYRDACAAMAAALAERYGRHQAVGAWQIDNEYGCHDTIRTAGPIPLARWRRWLETRYGSVDALNDAWWTGFWSMHYRSFAEVELPVGAVTEAAPGARLDYARFASAMAVEFHARQVAEIRPRSPGRPITHNGMIFFADLDAHALGAHLDIITWDSYPLGMLEQSPLPDDVKVRYARTGHPDLIAFNHDLYRGALAPRSDAPFTPFWVMEQQPGQVNWAPTNPLPAPGAVRLWTHQAIAHGADVVSYFRWRSALGAQEHMHAGLLRHDRSPDRGLAEAASSARDLDAATTGAAERSEHPRRRGDVALLFRYDDLWAGQIQPHAAGWHDWNIWVEAHSALRSLGFDVDVLPPDRDLSAYRLIVAPSLMLVDDALVAKLRGDAERGATVLLGPRSGAYRPDMRVHDRTPPPLTALSGTRTGRVDTLRPGSLGTLTGDGEGGIAVASYHTWADLLEPEPGTTIWARYTTSAYAGEAALTVRPHGAGRCVTLGAWLEASGWHTMLARLARDLDLPTLALPEGVRLSSSAGRACLQNFTDAPVEIDLTPLGGSVHSVAPVDVVWVDIAR